MASNPMLQQHRVSFSHTDGEQKLRKRIKSRFAEETHTQMDLQSARFMEHGISIGMHRAKKEREMKTKEEVSTQFENLKWRQVSTWGPAGCKISLSVKKFDPLEILNKKNKLSCFDRFLVDMLEAFRPLYIIIILGMWTE